MKKLKVLVIDDDADFLREIHGLLSEQSYDVRTCHDASQAIFCVNDYNPDKVVLDLAMPVLNGRQILDILRKRYPLIPVLICTGVPDIDINALRRAGASQIFQKPFSSEDFFSALDKSA